MPNLVKTFYFKVDKQTYYYWDNNKITTSKKYNKKNIVSNPAGKELVPRFPIGQSDIPIAGEYRNVWVDGSFSPPVSSVIKTESYVKQEKEKTKKEAEGNKTKPAVSTEEYEDDKYLNDGNYSANIVADPKYNFNETDNADSEKITNFINEMGVRAEDGSSIDIRQSNIYKGLLASKNLLPPDLKNGEIFEKTYRFGYYNLDASLSRTKEYLFFTKPDLNILIYNKGDHDDTGIIEIYDTLEIAHKEEWLLNPGLINPFWVDMYNSKKRIIKCLQSSYYESGDRFQNDPFIHLLANQVNTNLEIPELSADVVETAVNRYGTSIFYRGSSEPSDDGLSFSLEFKDTKWLDVYYFFRAYEEYETAKHLGTLLVKPEYIRDKILYDQMAVYKFVLDMDMETILYWGKYYGVTPMSLPRDTFSSDTFDNGLSYSIQFKAQFYEDMKPEILQDFNFLNRPIFGEPKIDRKTKQEYYSYDSDPSGQGYEKTSTSGLYDLRPYNPVLGRVDNRPAVAAYVQKNTTGPRADQSPNGYVYKLHWRGVDRY